jgi:hypothetical protein
VEDDDANVFYAQTPRGAGDVDFSHVQKLFAINRPTL